MSEERQNPEPPAPHAPENPNQPDGGRFIYLFVAMIPIPVGLLFGSYPMTQQLLGAFQRDKPGFSAAVCFGTFTLICCLAGGIGLRGGFKKGIGSIIDGIGIGLVLGFVDVFVVGFAGCYSELHKI